MRRADRLFRIVQMLRSGRLLTGAQLAARLEVSTRTLYRDIADLQASGVMIEGEAGVGYTLRREMDLPPMQFTAAETVALVLGARMAAAWGSTQVAAGAAEAIQKIEAVLPAAMREEMDSVLMFAPPTGKNDGVANLLDRLHRAAVSRNKVKIRYEKLAGEVSERVVWPLALAFWGNVWTLTTWCERRESFRNFRVDRVGEAFVLEERFAPKRGQRLKDFVRTVVPEAEVQKMGLRN